MAALSCSPSAYSTAAGTSAYAPATASSSSSSSSSSSVQSLDVLCGLRVPWLVCAPMAGGPSTPALVAAVGKAGALAFLAAGYLTPDKLQQDIDAVKQAAPTVLFGVNLFMAQGKPASREAVDAYTQRLQPDFDAAGVKPGAAVWNDDSYPAKLEVAIAAAPAVVSFTFGCPSAETVRRVHAAGSAVWVTVCDANEAQQAMAAGADALVAQGSEAGGHRGSFQDDAQSERVDFGVLTLLQLIQRELGHDAKRIPIICAGGVATGQAAAGLLVAGASAVQVGSGFLLATEAGTHALHRAAVASPNATSLTRAWSGRLARGVLNRFQRTHTAAAPAAYPEVHFLTSTLRAHARSSGDAGAVNCWAGEAHVLATQGDASHVVSRFEQERKDALRALASHVSKL